MSNALSVQADLTPEQMRLVTEVIAKNATPDELKLFLYRCKSLGLDPLKPGQIYFIKYGSGPGTIVVGIEGFRAKANRTGKLSGIKRGALRDEKGVCVGAWAEVYRSDWQHPAREEVPLSEYNTNRGNWQKMPETMIKKVAEAAALRMAFPDDLGGVYTQEEMEQAERTPPPVVPEQPGPNDGNGEHAARLDAYVIPGHLGQELAGKHPEDCDPEVLRTKINEIEAKYKGKIVPPGAIKFVRECEPIVARWENQSA
jgi:phage recombination protein Bet